MNPTSPLPLDGAYYWLPSPDEDRAIRWDLITCHDLGARDGVSHREFWPSVLEHLAPSWGFDPVSFRNHLADHYYALPRGRVTRPKGRHLILHGRDAPVPDWEPRIIDRFHLSGQKVRALSDDHERFLREDVLALEGVLGVDLGLLMTR